MALGARRFDIAPWCCGKRFCWPRRIRAGHRRLRRRLRALPPGLILDLLYGIKADDVTPMVLATATLIVVAAFAGLLPARRASRIDPMSAIRYK